MPVPVLAAVAGGPAAAGAELRSGAVAGGVWGETPSGTAEARLLAAGGGVVILSGVLNEQRAGVEAIYRGHGFGRMGIEEDGEWSTIVLRRFGVRPV